MAGKAGRNRILSNLHTNLGARMQAEPIRVLTSLKYAIDEAHKRGMELHVWFNCFAVGTAQGSLPGRYTLNGYAEIRTVTL